MSYAKNGFPIEPASKIGQLRIINDPVLQGIIKSFESAGSSVSAPLITISGHVDLKGECEITRIVVIDGGEAIIPNPIRRERALGFVTAAALLLRMDDYEKLASNPMADPRDISKQLEDKLWYKPTAVPLSGVSMPGMNVREALRAVVNSTLSHANTGLIDTLRFLVYREWVAAWPSDEEPPSMDCFGCGQRVTLPYKERALSFACALCGHQHYLSDYLGICEIAPDFGRETTVSNLRNVLEVLMLFDLVRKYRDHKSQLAKTLFIKDGPLLLRAQLSRLVEPIRSLIAHLRDDGVCLHVVGIEKNGPLVSLVEEFKHNLLNPGDFFLPSVKFLLEEVSGNEMPVNYRNRVLYGAKVPVRLGPDHVVVLSVPTGGFVNDPRASDLIGFESTVKILSRLVSYRYPNALVPLVLVNSMVSIAQRPSSTILEAFATGLIGTAQS
jgi:hypothetical protein